MRGSLRLRVAVTRSIEEESRKSCVVHGFVVYKRMVLLNKALLLLMQAEERRRTADKVAACKAIE